jgi:hypothetical protein
MHVMKSMQQPPERSSRRRYTWKQGFISAAILATLVYLMVVIIYAPIGGDDAEERDPGIPGTVPSIVASTPTP